MPPAPLIVGLAVGIATVVGAAVYSVASFFSSPGGEEFTITLESSAKRSESSNTERRQPPSKRWYDGGIHGSCKHEKGIPFGSLDQSSSTERSENLIIEWQLPPSTGRYNGDTDGSYNLEKEESDITEPPCTNDGSYKLGKVEWDITERFEGLITDGSCKQEKKILAIPDHQSSTERLDRTIIEWKRPEEGCHKVNTDCSCEHQRKISGVGGLIRDHSGEWKLGFGEKKIASHFSSSSSGREESTTILQSSAERSSTHWRTNGSCKYEEGMSEKSINEWQPPVNRSCHDGNADGSCKREKKTLSIPESSTAKRLERSISRWQQPPEGWHKVNTDCSCKPKMKKSGVGGLIRDHSGEWKLGFVARIEWKKGKATDRAELWGIYYGLKVAWEGGFRRIVLESDNKSVVEKVQMIMSAPNCDDPLLMKVKKLRQRKWKTKVVFIPREMNACADFMAEIAVNKTPTTIGLQLLEKPPRDCRRRIHYLISKDL